MPWVHNFSHNDWRVRSVFVNLHDITPPSDFGVPGGVTSSTGKLCFHYKSVYKFCFLCISPLPSSPVHWLQVNIACAHCSHKHKEMHFFTRVLTAKMPILFHTKDLDAHTQGEKTWDDSLDTTTSAGWQILFYKNSTFVSPPTWSLATLSTLKNKRTCQHTCNCCHQDNLIHTYMCVLEQYR